MGQYGSELLDARSPGARGATTIRDDNAMNIGDWLPVMATFSACWQNNHHLSSPAPHHARLRRVRLRLHDGPGHGCIGTGQAVRDRCGQAKRRGAVGARSQPVSARCGASRLKGASNCLKKPRGTGTADQAVTLRQSSSWEDSECRNQRSMNGRWMAKLTSTASGCAAWCQW